MATAQTQDGLQQEGKAMLAFTAPRDGHAGADGVCIAITAC